MTFDLSNKNAKLEGIGNKAKNLYLMKNSGFTVPGALILDGEVYIETIKRSGIEQKLNEMLSSLNKENVQTVSGKITELFDKAELTGGTKLDISAHTNESKRYAVRSSCMAEDLKDFSFAGQYLTTLNVDKKDIPDRVIDCYRSMFSETVLSYLIDNDIDFADYRMCVIVQEMVDADYSGIAFTLNPTTGNDKEMLIEVSEGLGENIVSGKTKPEQYLYDWYDEHENSRNSDNKLISPDKLREFAEVFSGIQQLFGVPCDIEFAVAEGTLYILQARAITKIQYQGIKDLWTTADFKDGGVSASVCTPYMWSLYEYIWEYSLRRFIVDTDILKDEELPDKLGEMFYGRCYWNLTAVKKAMSRVIGYNERAFDNTYGITGNYEGDGQTTGVTPKTVWGMIRIAIKQKRLLDDRRKNSERYKQELLDIYNDFKNRYDNDSIQDIGADFYNLTHERYLRSETTYFWQIFINTIHQSIYKDSLLKYVSESDYLALLGNIDNISHLLPFYDMWEVTRKIRKDSEAFSYWQENEADSIACDLSKDSYMMPEVRKLIGDYGYHSDKELDVSYPCYYEDPLPIIGMIKDMVQLDDSYSPMEDKERGAAVYKKKLEEIRGKVSDKKFNKIKGQIEGMRSMLWWREEFRDVSTRFYYLLRIYTIKYAEKLVADGVLEKVEDVWFLKVGNLWGYLDGKLTAADIRKIIEKNRKYYMAYRNYISENELGGDFTVVKGDDNDIYLQGLGAGNGQVTGTARVIEDFSQIGRLQEGDILVTRFTDTGWTPKFAILSGIVTEYGGILCHAAIVSREYGIPAIVCCKDAMTRIKDGQKITIDGMTGKVVLKGWMTKMNRGEG